MNELPSVSVIIPAYNRRETIFRCLDSVLAQTYQHLEILVVDDCSSDDTVALVRSHPDPRVRCIPLEQHAGAQGARNRGILQAQFDWIAFQDSDDEWLPRKLELQMAALARVEFDPFTLVYGNAYRFDASRGVKDIRFLPVVEGNDQYAALLQAPAPLYPTMLTSRKALEAIGLLDERVPSFQEWDTSILLARICRIIHLHEPLMVYHVGNSDAISGSGTRHVEGWQYIIRKYEDDIRKLCGEKVWVRLNVQLLGRCLDLGLAEYYDRYLSRLGRISEQRLQRFYLMLARKCGFKPDNLIYRMARRVCGTVGALSGGQGRIEKA